MKQARDFWKLMGAGLLGAAVTSPAFALDGDVIVPKIIAGYRYDSNVYRIANDEGSSSTIKTGGIGLQIDKTYGLQRFTLDSNVTRVLYSSLSALDATSREIASALNWKLTPSIGGNLIYHHSVTPNNFADVGFQTVRNLRTVDEKRVDVDWRPGAALHPVISLFEDEARSDQPTFQQENSKTRSVMAGLVYLFPSFNSVEAYVRRANGTYQDFTNDPILQLATDFRETEGGLRVHWVFNGLSTLDGFGGYLKRTHTGLDVRNFSGVVGQLTYNYQVTGKNKLEVAFNRQLFSSQADTYSYASQDDVRVAWNYEATAKTTIRPTITYQRRLFKGPVVAISQDFREYTRGASLDAVWKPLRSITVTATLAREKRAATLSTFNYVDKRAELLATLRF